MQLLRVGDELGHGQQDLHVVALPLDVPDLRVEILLVLLDGPEHPVFHLCVQVDRQPVVILELFVCILDLALRVPHYLVQLLPPFRDQPQD